MTLRTDGGDSVRISMGAPLQYAALRWSYVARQRQRWSRNADARGKLAQQIRAELETLGVDQSGFQALERADLIEVSVPFFVEERGWEGRVMPWEYVISTATGAARSGTLTVVRHLDRVANNATKQRSEARTLLMAELAPGGLRDRFSFAAERRQIESTAGLAFELLTDPSRDELTQAIDQFAPDVIHLAGVDNHQAAEMLGLETESQAADKRGESILDGIPLGRRGAERFELLDAHSAARLLAAAETKPRLVTCNIYHSGARLGALLVAEGAEAAIGFQDSFDDASAELFFANFYRTWRESKHNILLAFQVAWQNLSGQGHLHRGTGVVLWSATSLLDAQPVKALSRKIEDEQHRLREQAKTVVRRETITRENVHEWLQVKIVPAEDINYSLLHNDRDLFKSFEISKLQDGMIRGLSVEVVLCVGGDSFPYRTSVDLVQPVTTLASRVRVPLTSALIRAVSERMYTSLYVEIRLGDLEIYRETHRVALLPVDEWRFDRRDYIWLPSFVLPRDPAVARVIDSAQRYLAALADDSGAGFDGYQSFDEATGDATGVDRQVQAIWWAILQDTPLAYINPPPSYSESAQRLRTPGRVMAERRGTCIDLTLLLVACLEYVEIYPVLFLFTGHACPGYWRSEQAHAAFQELRNIAQRVPIANDPRRKRGVEPALRRGPDTPYVTLRDALAEIRQEIRVGTLVPIESVALTSRDSLAEAIELGRDNFARASEFDAMIDLLSARESGITPLPIVEDRP
ncbi:MAG: hypothetical protein RBT60_08875 [Candidatus Krumholzibacteria bacterium]|nr:hypothetical protein [Candidatus Krumholzibacteria bacterium]